MGIANAAACSTRIGFSKKDAICVVARLMPAGIAIKAGVPYSATDSRKIRIAAPTMDGNTSGSVTRVSVRNLPAPWIAAASSSSVETKSSADLVKT